VRPCSSTRILRAAAMAVVVMAPSAPAGAGAGAPWTLDWWTLDGGGEVFTTGGAWELSGTIGQWDATAHSTSVGGAWELTGGFWSIAVAESDHLFKDGFE